MDDDSSQRWTADYVARSVGRTCSEGRGRKSLNGGTDVEQCINVLLGVFTDDEVVNSADIVGVKNAEHRPFTIFADINGDGVSTIAV